MCSSWDIALPFVFVLVSSGLFAAVLILGVLWAVKRMDRE